MSLEFGTCSTLDEGAIQQRKVQPQTTEKVMMMSKDDWKAECTKVDDLKLTNARGNKIRGTIMPPIFSWDAQEASSRVQSKKETALIIDTKHGRLLRSRHLRQSKNHGNRPLEPCYSLVNQW